MRRTRNAVRAALRAEAEQLTSAQLQRPIKVLQGARPDGSGPVHHEDEPAVRAPRRDPHRRGWLVTAGVVVAVAALGILLSLQVVRSSGTAAPVPNPADPSSVAASPAGPSAESMIGRWSVLTILDRATGRRTDIAAGQAGLDFGSDARIVFSLGSSEDQGMFSADPAKGTLLITFTIGNAVGFTPGDPTTDAVTAARNSLFFSDGTGRVSTVAATLDEGVLTLGTGEFVIVATRTGDVPPPLSAPATTTARS